MFRLITGVFGNDFVFSNKIFVDIVDIKVSLNKDTFIDLRRRDLKTAGDGTHHGVSPPETPSSYCGKMSNAKINIFYLNDQI